MERLGRPGPSDGAGTGGGGEPLTAYAAREAGLDYNRIAALLWGAGRAAEEYGRGGWMHSRIKRRLKKARGIVRRYREIVAGG